MTVSAECAYCVGVVCVGVGCCSCSCCSCCESDGGNIPVGMEATWLRLSVRLMPPEEPCEKEPPEELLLEVEGVCVVGVDVIVVTTEASREEVDGEVVVEGVVGE